MTPRRRAYKGLWFAVCAGLIAPSVDADSAGAVVAAPRIAIIIDDLGYRAEDSRRAVRLPGPVTCSILPGSPLATDLSELAHAAGKDVMLHVPLEPVADARLVNENTLRVDMTEGQFGALLDAHFQRVPHAIGVNNHMGSLMTRNPGHMQWLMDGLARRGAQFFVDSFTTHDSVALRLARENGIPSLRRDVFIDTVREPAAIRAQLDRLRAIARQRGYAIAIGHPHPETLDVLEAELPRLADDGYRLIGLSELIAELASGGAPPWHMSSSPWPTAAKK